MKYGRIIDDLKTGRIYTDLQGDKRSFWPNYCYHFTDLRNALNIFKLGKICSRRYANRNQLMINENASEKIINSTNSKAFNYVRLYLRPQVPMLYDVEGFRPKDYYKYSDKTKCSFPIYFLFNLSKILELKNSRFSPISLATHTQHMLENGPSLFSSMPFEAIYSDRSLNGLDKGYYINHKHAEVVVPNTLSLDLLNSIVVRSAADADTLKQELLDLNLNKYLKKIKIDDKNLLFFKNGGYFDKVSVGKTGFDAKLNIPNNYLYDSRYQYISKEQLDKYLGYKIVIKFPNSDRKSIIFPIYDGEYCSKRECSSHFYNNDNKPYIVKLYLNTTKEPAYYNKYIPKGKDKDLDENTEISKLNLPF